MIVVPLVAVTALAGLAAWKIRKRGKVTPERQKIYTAAMNRLLEPEKLRDLADAFQKVGLVGHANMLRKRADLREMPAETKIARREVFKKAMSSTNKDAIRQVANVFESEGAIGAAADLRKYADGLPDIPPASDIPVDTTPRVDVED